MVKMYIGLHVKKLEFSRQIFEKYWNINFNEDLAVGAELCHADGRKDRQHDEGGSRFSQVCERP